MNIMMECNIKHFSCMCLFVNASKSVHDIRICGVAQGLQDIHLALPTLNERENERTCIPSLVTFHVLYIIFFFIETFSLRLTIIIIYKIRIINSW